MDYLREETFTISILKIVILGSVILSAFALQEAINSTIILTINYNGNGDIIAAQWVYAIVVVALTAILLWFGWSKLHRLE